MLIAHEGLKTVIHEHMDKLIHEGVVSTRKEALDLISFSLQDEEVYDLIKHKILEKKVDSFSPINK